MSRSLLRIGKGGNRTSQTIDGVTTTLEYDSANRLTSESRTGYSVSHEYDDWGNETERTTVTGSTTTVESYGYNALSRMSTYVREVNATVVAEWQYDYWPTGERQGKTNLLANNTGEVYATNGDNVVADYAKDASGNTSLLNTYSQGLGLDQKNLRMPASGGRIHYVGDAVGTVTSTLTDAGAKAEECVRDVWGNPLGGDTNDERYGFAQREHDTESGLVYMRHRMYDPRIGRFTQMDPILGNRATEHYRYAGNNPVRFSDPLGLDRLDVLTCGDTAYVFYVNEPGFPSSLSPWSTDDEPVFVGVMKGKDKFNVYIKDSSGKEVPVPLVHLYDEVNGGGTTDDWAAWAAAQDKKWTYSSQARDPERIQDSLRVGAGADYSWNTRRYQSVETLTGFYKEVAFNVAINAVSAISFLKGAKLFKNAHRIDEGWLAVNEAMSIRAAAYQTQITGKVGQVLMRNGVKFDGLVEGVLTEAKGPGYATFVKNGRFHSWFRGSDSLIDQARRQVAAARGSAIKWHVAEEKAAEAMRNLFKDAGIKGIDIVHTPVK